MKYLLLFIFNLFGHSLLMAQPPQIKIYAFSRETTPGIIPDLSNDSMKRPTVLLPKTYYIYAEIKKGYKITINTAFIDGRYYRVSMKKVKTPVIKDRYEGVMNSDQKDILVKKTYNDVYEIKLGDEYYNFTDKKNAESMRNSSAVMLIVNYKKTKLYPGLPAIKALNPVQGM